MFKQAVAIVFYLLITHTSAGFAAEKTVAFRAESGKLQILIGDRPVATYAFSDKKIQRPYFAHVKTMSGIQVTRRHPPLKGTDPTDHADMHPGIWLAFGDLSGADFWRNRADVKHAEFVDKPRGGEGHGSFTVRNEYRSGETVVCSEVCRYTVLLRPAGWFLICDSVFSNSDRAFTFGDQEEMGLGVRVATQLRVKGGNGRILNARGQTNEREVWGQAAAWADYSGTIDDRRVGMTLMPDPENFRKSWFHARDYGAIVANPFGRQALSRGKKSSIVVKPGEKFRFRIGVLIHESPKSEPVDLKAAYDDFVSQPKN